MLIVNSLPGCLPPLYGEHTPWYLVRMVVDSLPPLPQYHPYRSCPFCQSTSISVVRILEKPLNLERKGSEQQGGATKRCNTVVQPATNGDVMGFVADL